MKNNYKPLNINDDEDMERLQSIQENKFIERQKQCSYVFGYIFEPIGCILCVGLCVGLTVGTLPIGIPTALLQQYLTGNNLYFELYKEMKK